MPESRFPVGFPRLSLPEQTTEVCKMSDLITTQNYNSEYQLDRIAKIKDNYSDHVRDFVTWCKERNHGITEESVREYFAHLNDGAGYEKAGIRHDYSAATINVKRAAVKSRVRQLYENAPIDDQVKLDRVLANLDKSIETKAPKIASNAVGSDKVLSYAEIERLIAEASPSIARMIEFLFATGCRVSEMIRVKKSDCVRESLRVNILVHGKGSKEP